MQLTQMEMSEEARVQNAQAAGAQFMFGAQETRDMATLDRMSGQESQYRQDMANAQMGQAAADAAMISGVSSMASAKIRSPRNRNRDRNRNRNRKQHVWY